MNKFIYLAHSPASLAAMQALKHQGHQTMEAPVQDSVQQPVQPTSNSIASVLFFVGLLILVPCLLIYRFDPRVVRWLANEGKPTVAMGSVQSIQYVGHFGYLDTQINTDRQTLLVEGSASIRKGAAVEWRRSQLYNDLCVAGTQQCWDLIVGEVEDAVSRP